MAWEDSLVPEEHAIWHLEQAGLLGFTRELLAEGNFRTEAVLRLDEETTEHVREGLVFALDSSYPDPEEALEHVFSPAGD